MSTSKFNWDKLPKDEVSNFIELVKADKKKEVLAIHNKYKLSTYNFGCCSTSALINHSLNAIRLGKLR